MVDPMLSSQDPLILSGDQPIKFEVAQSIDPMGTEEGEIEERSKNETDQDPSLLPSAKKLGRKSNNQRREATVKKYIDLGKQSTLDGHSKKEPQILRNKSGYAFPEGGLPKSSSK
jgi:hypothetical protein